MATTAILLAAGYATRLHPLTKDQPKALLPLGEGVILDAVIRTLREIPDLTRTILVTNHRFAGHFRRWQQASGLDVEVIDDRTETNDTRLGAIRDLELARIEGKAEGDLLVLGTDNVFSWSLADMVAQAREHAPHASVALWEAPSPESATQFGVVVLDGGARIEQFVEKSPNPPSAAVALAMYYFPEAMHHRIQEFIDGGGNPDAPGYFLEWLTQHDELYGVMMGGAWYDIGTLDTYQQVQREWNP